ncbi:MAG TPA: hypothetical protein VMU56_10350 [Beijerinckiaceae bacterium]|nr:hypothetical protein [Beijerinckiaceae bacterium]
MFSFGAGFGLILLVELSTVAHAVQFSRPNLLSGLRLAEGHSDGAWDIGLCASKNRTIRRKTALRPHPRRLKTPPVTRRRVDLRRPFAKT